METRRRLLVSPSPCPLVCTSKEHVQKRWRSLLLRVFIAILIAWVLATVPIPRMAPHTWFAYVQVPIVIFLLICYIGKLMIDTFFYDRYNP